MTEQLKRKLAFKMLSNSSLLIRKINLQVKLRTAVPIKQPKADESTNKKRIISEREQVYNERTK